VIPYFQRYVNINIPKLIDGVICLEPDAVQPEDGYNINRIFIGEITWIELYGLKRKKY
jgi:hypothetical protein